jgi:hypothetical protein
MSFAVIYQIRWSGTLSNVAMLMCCLFFAVVAVYCVVTIIRVVRKYRHEPKALCGGGTALIGFIIFALSLILTVAGRGSSGGSSGSVRAGAEGAIQGYARSQGTSDKVMLVTCLIGLPLIIALFITGLLMEEPLAIAVTPTRIEMIYRLPWRHTSIDVKQIRKLELKRTEYRGNGGFKYDYLSVLINHDGVRTTIPSEESPQSQEQLREAYKEIESYVPKSVVVDDHT